MTSATGVGDEIRRRFGTERGGVDDEVIGDRIVEAGAEVVPDELEAPLVLVAQLVGRHVGGDALLLGPALRPGGERGHREHAEHRFVGEEERGAASHEDGGAAARQRHHEALHRMEEVVLGEAGALKEIGEVTVDGAADAPVETVQQLLGESALGRDLVDDLTAEAGESEPLRDPLAKETAARARQAGNRDAGLLPRRPRGLLPAGELQAEPGVGSLAERHGGLLECGMGGGCRRRSRPQGAQREPGSLRTFARRASRLQPGPAAPAGGDDPAGGSRRAPSRTKQARESSAPPSPDDRCEDPGAMPLELNEILKIALKGGASDIHLKSGLPPIFRVDGALVPLKNAERLLPDQLEVITRGIMNPVQKERFETNHECDLAYGIAGLGRFRVNVFQQRGTIGVVFRVIPFGVKTIEQLYLPKVVESVANEQRGLILVTGTTGSGKSTTLAAMIEHINSSRTCHIMTIEDPIEFLIRDRRSIVNQREIGVDTNSFSNALRAALRQDPDVILVGEMRDFETIETALLAAETGHLVLSTLHTLAATETINRIVSVFPPYQQKQVRLQLTSILRGVISQRLVPRADGKGRVPALEVMVTTARVRELITDKDRTKELHDAIAKGFTSYGMQTFDQSLMQLVKQNLVTYEEALKHVSNPDDFALRFRGIASPSDGTWDDFDGSEDDEAVDAEAEKSDADEAAGGDIDLERF